jgi:hypothetical protein
MDVKSENANGLSLGGGSNCQILTGSGSPSGVVSAPSGSLYLRNDGAGGSHIYVGQGGTAWTAIATV